MQTRAIFGLVGAGFLDAVTGEYIGFSATANRMAIEGGHENAKQANSVGVHLTSFQQVGDVTVEVEGITDATAAMIARLRGGKLVAGTDTLNAALRPTSVLPQKWGATAITVVAGMAPKIGAYSIERIAGNAHVIRQLFTNDASRIVGDDEGVVATADFMVASVPAAIVQGDFGYFFVEPATTVESGEWVFGSLNLPKAVTVIGLTQTAQSAVSDNVNTKRITVPRMQINPVAENNASNEFSAIGPISGMGMHDQGIGGVYKIGWNYGAA